MALIDANSGLSLLGGTGLTRSDALLNLQADGTEIGSARFIDPLNEEPTMFDLASTPGSSIYLVAAGRITPPALVAPAPNWLSKTPDLLKSLVEDLKLNNKSGGDVSGWAGYTYSEKGPLGIPPCVRIVVASI